MGYKQNIALARFCFEGCGDFEYDLISYNNDQPPQNILKITLK